MTRRDVIRIGLGLPGVAALPAWAASSKESWNNKPSSDWTQSEIQDLLSRSPWAKEVTVSDNGPGIDFSRGSGGGGGGNSPLPAGGIPGLPSGPPMGRPFLPQDGPQRFKATVRWDSALPIREAMHVKPSKDFDQTYIIAVTGDLPDMGRIVGADGQTLDAARLESVKQFTRLERKGSPILLSRMAATPDGYPSGGGTLFYFERRDPILAEDKQVIFVTRVGAYEVKARFNLKDMLYHGKLEL
jgi:hypothetical protein